MRVPYSAMLRGAVLVGLFVGACRDAPLEPRTPNRQPLGIPTLQQAKVQVFSGVRADSVLDVLDKSWAKAGHPEYRQRRREWRRHNGIGKGDGSRLPPMSRETVPITGTVDGTEQFESPPRIMSHYEALHFGYLGRSLNIPDGVEAEMVFVGDQGQIGLASLTITRKSGGTPYTTSGQIVLGPGDLVGCADTFLAECANTRRLGGVALLPDAPRCDATGAGAVNYTAMNIKASVSVGTGFTSVATGGTTSGESVVTAANINQIAPPCPPPDDSTKPPPPPQAVDTVVVTTPIGGSATDPIGIAGPTLVPTSEVNDPAGTPYQEFWCEQVDLYEIINGNRFLIESKIECYKA